MEHEYTGTTSIQGKNVNKQVSVIIPAYNCEKFVAEAIESALRQDYAPVEVIVVDDGSTDGTKEEILKYKSSVNYIYQENQGLGGARSTGIEHAKGEYVAFLDADDILHDGFIGRQIAFLDKNPEIDIVYFDYMIIDSLGNDIKVLKSENVDNEKNNFLAYLLFRHPMQAHCFFRKKCFDVIRYPKHLRRSEDYWTHIQMARHFRFGYLEEVLYKYRRHENNMTNKMKEHEESEIATVRQMGTEEIRTIVNNSSFSDLDKKILLGKIFYKIRSYDEAAEVFTSIQSSNMWQIHFYMGNCSYIQGDYPDAIAHYKKALEINGARAETHNNLAAAYFKEQDIAKANHHTLTACRIKPDYMDARLNAEIFTTGLKMTFRELRDSLSYYNL